MAELKKIDTPDMYIQDQKHEINTELIGIIKFRQNKKWLISIAVVALFSLILGLMIYFMSSGGWMERNPTADVRWFRWFVCQGH